MNTFNRFLQKIKISKNGCWLWQGRRHHRRGYGGFQFGGKWGQAHRYAFQFFRGKHPGALLVCHKCDNPPCVNPTHLFLGTNDENMKDMVRKGRARNVPRFGLENPACKLTDTGVAALRQEWFSLSAPPWGFQASLARKYGISVAQTCRVIHGKRRGNKFAPGDGMGG